MVRVGRENAIDLFSRIEPLLIAQAVVNRFLIAYSGGVDSHVLLHLLATHRRNLDPGILAVYVDHGLHPDSGAWGRHCERICRELNVDFLRFEVDARAEVGQSPEAAARHARYRVFEGLLAPGEALLTAHQQDDQAETLFLQLLRGSGPAGLAAMPAIAPFARGLLLRPLLGVERIEILSYAKIHALKWIDDSSNADCGFDRNYLRHDIFPLLKKRWPAAARTMARSARLCAESVQLLDELADDDLARAATQRGDCLRVAVLKQMSEAQLRNALRRWFRQMDLPAPGSVHLQHVLRDVIAAPRDREACVRWPGAEVRCYRDELYAMASLASHDPARIIAWRGDRPLFIPGIGRLSLRPAGEGEAQILDPAVLAGVPVKTIRFRRGGERLRPAGHRHHRELKKLFQEAGVPPWERDRVPLLYAGEEMAAIAGLWVAAQFAVRPGKKGLVLEWQKPPPFAKV